MKLVDKISNELDKHEKEYKLTSLVFYGERIIRVSDMAQTNRDLPINMLLVTAPSNLIINKLN
jgi:hypothetical protein